MRFNVNAGTLDTLSCIHVYRGPAYEHVIRGTFV
jgi:hypothetical protein